MESKGLSSYLQTGALTSKHRDSSSCCTLTLPLLGGIGYSKPLTITMEKQKSCRDKR